MGSLLKGKRVWISRPELSAKAMAKLFENQGAEAINIPLIQLHLKEDLSELHAALDQLESFEWIVFTSENAVRFFFEAAVNFGIKFYFYPNLKIATVGEKTKIALEQLGYRTNFVPIEYTAEVLAANMDEEIAGKRVLIPRSAIALDDYLDLFERRGAKAEAISIYENEPIFYSSEELKETLSTADYLTFTSASAVSSLAEQIDVQQTDFSKVRIVCIGPSAAERAKEVGLEVAAVATPHTAEGILSAIEKLEENVTT